jgi:MbtH protein
MTDQPDPTQYRVVVNPEGQYSIWPTYKEIPIGWRDVGKSGTKQECLEYVKAVWTDMRPDSLMQPLDQKSDPGSDADQSGN